MLGGRIARTTLGLLLEHEVLLVVSTSTALVMLGQGVTAPVLPLFARSFGVSAAAVGLTLSAFAVARLVVNVPAGVAADRWGRRLLLVGGPLVTGLGNLLSATAPDLAWLLAWRFLAGVGSSLYMTGAIIAVTDIADDTNRGRMLAVNQGALLLGVTVGPAVGGVTAEFLGLRAPFLLVGALALLAGAANWLRVPETRAPATAPDPPPSGQERRSERRPNVLRLLRSADFLLIGFVTFAVFFARSGRQTVLPLFGEDEAGLSEATIGAAFALLSALNLALITVAGAAVDRFGVKATILPSALISGVGFALYILIGSSAAGFFLASFVLGVGSGTLGPAPPAYAAAIVPAEVRGAAMGLYRTLGDLGFVLSPPLVGLIADHVGYDAALALNGSMLVFASLVFVYWGRSERTLAEQARLR